jgi:hypothetical protein
MEARGGHHRRELMAALGQQRFNLSAQCRIVTGEPIERGGAQCGLKFRHFVENGPQAEESI